MGFGAFRLFLVAYFGAAISTAVAEQPFEHLCGQDITSHNASRFFTWRNSETDYINKTIGETAWAITVDESNGLSETDLWYSTGVRDYAKSKSEGFDACAWVISEFPKTVAVKAPGDTGDCSTAILPACYNALKEKFTASALKWSSTRWSGGNSTTLSSDELCKNIKKDTKYNATIEWPEQCWDDFAYNPTKDVGANTEYPDHFDTAWELLTLTDNANQSFRDCSTHSSRWSGGIFNNVYSDPSPISTTGNQPYVRQVQTMFLAITLFTGIESHQNGSIEPWAVTQPACLLPTNFNKDSEIVPVLTNNTSTGTGNTTSHGGSRTIKIVATLAGVIPVLMLAAFVVMMCLRKRKKRAKRLLNQSSKDSDSYPAMVEAPGQDTRAELGASNHKELAGSSIVEINDSPMRMEAGGVAIHEMSPGDGWLAELPEDCVSKTKEKLPI